MNRLKTKSLSFLLLVLTSQRVSAAEQSDVVYIYPPTSTDCVDAIEKADSVIAAQAAEIQQRKIMENWLTVQLKNAQESEAELLARQRAWYRDPYLIGAAMFIVGATVGLRSIK